MATLKVGSTYILVCGSPRFPRKTRPLTCASHTKHSKHSDSYFMWYVEDGVKIGCHYWHSSYLNNNHSNFREAYLVEETTNDT